MARSDTLRREIDTVQAKGAGLAADLARHQDAASKATAAASKKRSDASRTGSDSTRRSATSAAEREDKKATDALKKVSELQSKVAVNSKAITAKRTSLGLALKDEQRAQDRDDERRRQKERTLAQQREREDARRRQTEKTHARELAAIGQQQRIRYIEVQPPKPEPLRVLYLTANPEAVETTVQHPDGSVETTGVWLRVDFEVRQVRDLLKKSKFRDLVSIEHLPAATSMDLPEGLNDHRPHVVHFSGHAASWGLLMDNAEGTTHGDAVDFSLFARLLGATDHPPRLVVLNACESLAGADDLLQTVPTVIGMSGAINDASAVVFAARFYSAIASAQSVANAIEQGKVAMEAAALEGSELPEVRTREGVDPNDLVLVSPSS